MAAVRLDLGVNISYLVGPLIKPMQYFHVWIQRSNKTLVHISPHPLPPPCVFLYGPPLTPLQVCQKFCEKHVNTSVENYKKRYISDLSFSNFPCLYFFTMGQSIKISTLGCHSIIRQEKTKRLIKAPAPLLGRCLN